MIRASAQAELEEMAAAASVPVTGVSVAIATPPDYRPETEIVADAAEVAMVAGGTVLITSDPEEAVRGAHAVYTDVWTSMGEDAERERRLRDLHPYRVDTELLVDGRQT